MIGAAGAVVVGDRVGGEEEADEGVGARDLRGDAGVRERVAQTGGEPLGGLLERGVRRVVELGQNGEPGRGGERIPRERPGLVHRPEGRQLVHHVGPPAHRGERESAADDLAEDRQVGRDAVARLGAPEPYPEARDHLVEHQQRAVTRSRVRAVPSRKPGAGATRPMFAAIGSTRIAAVCAPCSASAASSAARSL